jgi:hypothetical protein
MSGGSSGQDTTTTTEPWDAVKGPLQQSYRAAQGLYGGDTVYPWSSLDYGQRQGEATRSWGGGVNSTSLGGILGVDPASMYWATETGVVPTTPSEAALKQTLTGAAGQNNDWLYQTGQRELGNALNGQTADYRYLSSQLFGGAPETDQLQKVSSGAYVGSNPYLDSMYQAASRPVIDQFNTQVLPGITGQFAAGGRYGSGAQQFATSQAAEGLGRNLTDMSANLYGSAYESERSRQDAATQALTQARQNAAQSLTGIRNSAQQMLPTLGTAGLRDAQLRASMYGTVADIDESAIREALGVAQGGWDEREMLPYDKLALYQSFLNTGGSGGGFGSVTGPGAPKPNRTAGAAGGAMAGAAAGAPLAGATYGLSIPIGALIGGTAGYFATG